MIFIKLFEEFNQELGNLIELLKKYDVPVDLWGTGKSKTVQHLLKELQGNECNIQEEGESITRYIEFVGIKIYYTDENDQRWFLKEEKQEFNDGRIRRRNIPSSVSEKMKFGEDPSLSAIRGIKEELGVEINQSQLSKHSDLHYDGGSVSYPGLDTKYKGHRFICNFNDTQFNPNGYIEVQEDKKTFFVWNKIN
jgi:hypothetical protein